MVRCLSLLPGATGCVHVSETALVAQMRASGQGLTESVPQSPADPSVTCSVQAWQGAAPAYLAHNIRVANEA